MTDYPTPDPAAPQSTAADATSPENDAVPAASPDAQPVPAQGPDVAALAREREEFKDLLLRKTAEFENYRRRTEKERRDLIDHANADLVRALLPLVDDFERALQVAPDPDSADAYRLGVELIHKQLLEVLARYGVTPIDPIGADFDPHVHEAVVRGTDPSHRDGEIVEVFARGYQMRDRLLRPAKVRVAQS